VADSPDLERDFQVLSSELRKLEGEYNMYFAGRIPRPPLEARGRLDQLFKGWDRRPLESPATRFRLQTLQSRYSSFVDLWDRALRAREEGRPSPLYRPRETARTQQPVSSGSSSGSGSDVAHAVTFNDPRQESDKLQQLYDQLMDARRQAGEGVVPFHKFADLVAEQTQRLKKKGLDEVTFSVSTTGGRVNLTAKGSKSNG
jgi:hypothetical protein